jgi:hypothetical protein
LTKAKPIPKRQAHPLASEDVKDYECKGSVAKRFLFVSLKRLGAKTVKF